MNQNPYLICDKCGWTGKDSDLVMPFSDWPAVCPDCWSDSYLEESDPALDEIDRLVESINGHTETIKRIDEKLWKA